MKNMLFMLVLVALVGGVGLPSAQAQGKGQPKVKSVSEDIAARFPWFDEDDKAHHQVKSVSGALLMRAKGKVWQAVKAGTAIPDGALLVALPRAEIVAGNGAVRVELLADIGERGPFPVLETAVILNQNAEADLDIGFTRGLIILENPSKPAKVVVRFRDEKWTLELQEAGTKVGLEIFGRHPPGHRAIDPKADDPTTDLLALVMKGRVFVDNGKEGLRLTAPPGTARLHWDSVGRQSSVLRLEKLPDKLALLLHDQEEAAFKEMCHCAHALTQADMGAALDKLVKAESKTDRMVGVTACGALDELPRLLGVLAASPQADARRHAIVALRHWLGREPGQVKKLIGTLTGDLKLTPVQATSFTQLLLGFDAEERQEPATYDLLIHYLKHKHLAVRELAHWHLVRLAPAGKDLPYEAGGTQEQRQQGYERWRALIPEGELPPLPGTEKK